jgi:hypothetical protein
MHFLFFVYFPSLKAVVRRLFHNNLIRNASLKVYVIAVEFPESGYSVSASLSQYKLIPRGWWDSIDVPCP